MGRIAFFVQNMLCGGVENALINLSGELAKSGHDVTIYVIVDRGEFIEKIPKEVKKKTIPMPGKIRDSIPVGGTKITVRNNIQNRHYINAVRFLIRHVIGRRGFAELNVNFDKIPVLDEKYDIAVNYHIHSPFLVRYLYEKVKAKKKLTWIHNDFTTTEYNIKVLQEYLYCCEAFYGVSQKIVDEFKAIFPTYADRTFLALNIIPADEILHKANEYVPDEYAKLPENCRKLLSVGRLEEQKGYDITIAVCKELLSEGLKFQWFVLGEGSERSRLEKEIMHLKLENTLHFLGIRMNPYPYFKECDIYVQTSRHEGYVTTVSEAKIFNKPIVCTDVSGAREQIEDGVTGDIAEINTDSIVKKLSRLLRENERCSAYSNALSRQTELYKYDWLKTFNV